MAVTYYVMAIAALIFSTSVAQDPETLNICPHGGFSTEVGLPAIGYGQAKYMQPRQDQSGNCSLSLSGFRPNSIAAVANITSLDGGNCIKNKTLIINDELYCFADTGDVQVLRADNFGYINLTIYQPLMGNHTISYYQNAHLGPQYFYFDIDISGVDLNGVIVIRYPSCDLDIAILNRQRLLINFQLLQGDGVFIGQRGISQYISSQGLSVNTSDDSFYLRTCLTHQLYRPAPRRLSIQYSVVTCGLPPVIPNADYRLPALPWLPNSTIEDISCKPGFELKNTSTSLGAARCSVIGREVKWILDSSCQQAKCVESPPVIDNGYLSTTNPQRGNTTYTSGDMLTYTCKKHFELYQGMTVTCLKDGSWSTAPTCIPEMASLPVSNAGATGFATAFGAVLIIITLLIVAAFVTWRRQMWQWFGNAKRTSVKKQPETLQDIITMPEVNVELNNGGAIYENHNNFQRDTRIEVAPNPATYELLALGHDEAHTYEKLGRLKN